MLSFYELTWFEKILFLKKILGSFVLKTIKGAIASFADCIGGKAKSVKCDIVPSQSGSGTPSPDNVRPISGWTATDVNVCGFNVWDEEWEVGLISASNGQNTPSDQYSRTKNYISVKPNTGYYLKNVPHPLYLRRYGIDKSFLSYAQIQGNFTYTVPSDTYYLRFCWDGTTYNNDISINYPSTDTSYHAYSGQTYEVNWSDEVGTIYGGTVDAVSGVVTVDTVSVSFVGKTSLAGWAVETAGIVPVYCNPNNFTGTGANDYGFPSPKLGERTVICDWLNYGTNVKNGLNANMNTSNDTFYRFELAVPIASASVGDTWTSQKDAVIDYLNNNPLQLAYKLAEPITYQLSEQQIALLKGANNVWSTSGGETEVTYKAEA